VPVGLDLAGELARGDPGQIIGRRGGLEPRVRDGHAAAARFGTGARDSANNNGTS
jgi:hypothetical protein